MKKNSSHFTMRESEWIKSGISQQNDEGLEEDYEESYVEVEGG